MSTTKERQNEISRIDTAADRSRAREHGMTLLITLGFLSLLMMLTLSLAVSSRTARRAAAVNADTIRARLLAESALDRALSKIEQEFAGQVYPADFFYEPSLASAWAGRRYLASINGSDTAGIAEAFGTTFAGVEFLPEEELHSDAGWFPITSTQRVLGQDREVLIGRCAYLIVDESGKIDPGAVVSAEDSEPSVPEGRTGASPQDISLVSTSVPVPNAFRPTDSEDGTIGHMPLNGRWFSMAHVARALRPTTSQMRDYTAALHPFSYDVDKFWRDNNANGVWNAGEDAERLDLTGSYSLKELYYLFVGDDTASGDDDCAWLQEVDNAPWFQNWQTLTGATTVAGRRRVAAQIAANIIDYADEDSLPTPAHVDAMGLIQPGTCDVPDTYSVYGVENTWGVSELALQVKAEVIMTPSLICSLGGDLNVDPGNSWMDFVLITPEGTITRSTLLHAGAVLTYGEEGIPLPASEVRIKPKAQGRTLMLNGMPVNLAPNVQYTIRSESVANPMQVYLRNLNPGANNWNHAMGHWWIYIFAPSASITPDPGIPPVAVATALRVQPSLKAEAFYPYATGADVTNPPGTLTVSYQVKVETATGQAGSVDGAVVVPLDQACDRDGGTLAYSAGYAPAAPIEIADAFDSFSDPPATWYKVTLVQITAVTLRDSAGNVVDAAPIAAAGDAGLYLCNWSQSGSSTSSRAFYASIGCADPLFNDRGECDPAFAEYWTALPNTSDLASSDQSEMGALTDTIGYASTPFCDATVKNAVFARLGELGRVHSYQPTRSLRLWSATTDQESGHDAAILDLFKIGTATRRRGRVNVNTLTKEVLVALFDGATTTSASAAAEAVLSRRSDAAMAFTNIGEMFGSVAGVSGSDPTQDAEEEEAIAKLAELITVRQNYFTVIACAQALKDVGGIVYGGNLQARYGQLDMEVDDSGTPTRYVDRVLAEQKILAVVYRDAFSNRCRIDRLEFLGE